VTNPHQQFTLAVSDSKTSSQRRPLGGGKPAVTGSSLSLRQLFERLIEVDAGRELSGHETFNIYGL
jgi:hypothetical protein